jgi:acyl-CoA synthetase (AMP-forming)/AMP-acid ligase II
VLRPDGSPVEPGSGEVGVVAQRGAVPLGYHGDDDETARVFPVIDGVRWALPGDLATVEADGRLRLLGRGSSSINRGGEKISPEEVESVLKSHPDVFDAVVLGVADERWGERVVAVVQPRPGACPTTDDLAEHCGTELADFKAPRQVVLVDSVERLSTGKANISWARSVVAREADRSADQRSGYRSP